MKVKHVAGTVREKQATTGTTALIAPTSGPVEAARPAAKY
jgi:hypothetical protein